MRRLGRFIEKELEIIQSEDKNTYHDRTGQNNRLVDMYYNPCQKNIKSKKSFVFKWRFIASLSAALVILLSLTFLQPSSVNNIYHNTNISSKMFSVNELNERTDTITIKENFTDYNLFKNNLYYNVKTNETLYYFLYYTDSINTIEIIVIENLKYKNEIVYIQNFKEKTTSHNIEFKFFESKNNIYISYEMDESIVIIRHPIITNSEDSINAAINFLIEVI